MEITTTTVTKSPRGKAAIGALALVGFLVLLALGIWLAIYTARNMPSLSSKLGSASAYLSSIFHDDDDDTDPSLQVVTATSTLSFDEQATSTATTTIVVPVPGVPAPVKPVKHVGGTTKVTRIVTTTTTIDPYGDPDLSIKITNVGYLRSSGNTDSFVASDEIPSNRDGAVRFTVKNIGTNVSGSWKFTADLPTSSSGTHFTSPTQRSLKPGESIDFVLGFDHSRSGSNRTITVEVDPSRRVDESNEGNNEDSITVDIRR